MPVEQLGERGQVVGRPGSEARRRREQAHDVVLGKRGSQLTLVKKKLPGTGDISDSATTLGQGPNSHEIQLVTESDKAAVFRWGIKTVTNYESQNPIVTESDIPCRSLIYKCDSLWARWDDINGIMQLLHHLGPLGSPLPLSSTDGRHNRACIP